MTERPIRRAARPGKPALPQGGSSIFNKHQKSDGYADDSEAAWGPTGRIQKVLKDHSLASRGRAGLTNPADPQGTVRLAESPDLEGPEAVPFLREGVLLHEAGHLAHQDRLHGMGNRVWAARGEGRRLGPGPKEQATELERLRREPGHGERAHEEMVKQASEHRRDREGPLGVIRKVLDTVQDSPWNDETLSDFVRKRTGR